MENTQENKPVNLATEFEQEQLAAGKKKHAVWRGKETKQFIDWKNKKNQ